MNIRILEEADNVLTYYVFYKMNQYQIVRLIQCNWGKKPKKQSIFIDRKCLKIRKKILNQKFWKAKRRYWNGIIYRVKGYEK